MTNERRAQREAVALRCRRSDGADASPLRGTCGASVVVDVSGAGVPAVYYGPAHETAHSDDERVSLARLVQAAGVYALTILHCCYDGSLPAPSLA